LSKIRIYEDLCKGVEECGICVWVCPKTLFKPSPSLNAKGYRPPQVEAEEACTGCENCMVYCPDLAIAVAPRRRRKRGEE
jgi:2-oxoglutarate ferredoxin oxidoreductase subunit delta